MKTLLTIFILLIYYTNSQNSLQSNYGFSRINENINFNLNLYGDFNTFLGDFKVNQSYFGNSYLPTNSINDNQKLEFNWKKELYKGIYLESVQKLDYVGNNFNTDINNNLLNFRVLPGIRYQINENKSVNINYGYDNHQQLGIISSTPALNFSSIYNDNIDEYYLESNFEHFQTQRTLNRNYKLNDLKLNLSRIVENSNLNINSAYNDIENDFVRLNQDSFQIEDRNESKLNLGLNFNYLLFENLSQDVSISYLNTSRNNSYREFDQNNLRSGVFEIRELNGYNVYSKLNYKYSNSLLRLTFQNYTENLRNTAKNKFLLNNNDLESQQTNISLLDYENTFSRIILNNNFILDYFNLFMTEFFYEINKYNTPSENENRDRDQIVLRLNQKYEHKFSQFFKFGLELEGRFRQLVYLKSENSINNIKERSLKFSPYYKYQNKKLEMTPEFQIFVNYRSYDYEYLFQTIRSDAQRSITLRDSINYTFNNKYRLNVSYIYRYRETGLFSWEKFSQTIFEEKNEFYSNIIFYLQKEENYYGVGLRYYNLQLISIRNLGNLGDSDFFLNSISPVVDFNIKIQDRTKLIVYGWYEYQKNNDRLRIIPNIKFETQVDLD